MGIFDKVRAEAESMAEKAGEMMKKKKGDQGGDQDAEQGQQSEPMDKAMQTAQNMINKQRGAEQDQAPDAGSRVTRVRAAPDGVCALECRRGRTVGECR